MPSPRITRHGKPPPVLPARPRELAEMMADGIGWKDAAVKMGIKPATARAYRGYPAFKGYYLDCLALIRDGERGRNLAVAMEIRDDEKLKQSAAGARARIESLRFMEDRDGPANVNVSVGVGIQANIAPGYAINIPDDYTRPALEILRRAHSTRNIIDDVVTIEADPVDDEAESAPIEPAPPPTPRRIEQPAPEFGRRDFGGDLPPRDSRRRALLLPSSLPPTSHETR